MEKARQSESSLSSSVNLQLKRYSVTSDQVKEAASIGSASIDSRYRRKLGFYRPVISLVPFVQFRFFQC